MTEVRLVVLEDLPPLTNGVYKALRLKLKRRKPFHIVEEVQDDGTVEIVPIEELIHSMRMYDTGDYMTQKVGDFTVQYRMCDARRALRLTSDDITTDDVKKMLQPKLDEYFNKIVL